MDEFLQETYVILLRKWLLNHSFKQNLKSNDLLFRETEYGLAEITFNPLNIIELKVTHKKTGEIDFYLHFQMKTLKHAIDLYKEMIDSLNQLTNKSKIRLLLCCSGGYTTGFFALKINEAIKVLELDMEVTATGYHRLYQEGNNYDVILLAPQVSFLQAEAQKILKGAVVLAIPPKIFAKYDVGRIISLVKDALQRKEYSSNMQRQPLPLKISIESKEKIFCLSVFRNKERIHIAYRLYCQQKILMDNEIIKQNIAIWDMYDILDTVLAQYPDIATIGIAIPGIINQGHLSSSYITDIENNEVEKAFSSRYHQKILISNDINAAASGFYVSQTKFQSLVFLFQPIAQYAGAGIIVNGQMIPGKSHLAGEIQFLPSYSLASPLELSQTPEGTLKLVSHTLVSAISLLDPPAIVLFSDLIPDVNALKKEMKEFIPENYLPEIIKVDNVLEYILLGQMVLCTQK